MYVWANGDSYEGEWVNDLRQGNGTKKWKKYGDVYIGKWLNDTKHGYGEYMWSNGDRYLGKWRHGLMKGKGKKLYANGDVYEGKWTNVENLFLSYHLIYTNTLNFSFL